MKDVVELNYSITRKKSPNSGIEILKSILTFLILVYHCTFENLSDFKILKILNAITPFYFSTFFIINFYFTYHIFSSRKISSIKLRFLRVIIPYVTWPLIFIFINAFSSNKKINMENLLKDLYIQFLIGRRILYVFWFQFNLIINYLIFSIITLIFNKSHLYFFQIIILIAYILEYFGFNEIFLEGYNEDIKRSIGRLLKMIIFSITGFLLSSIKMLYFLKAHKIKSQFFCFLILALIIYIKIYFLKYHFFEGIILGLGGVCLLIIFALIPLDKITNISIIFLNKQITSYTAGIYYIHIKVQSYFEDSIFILRDGSIRGCVLNYFICYCICFLGMKLLGKTKLKYLFI